MVLVDSGRLRMNVCTTASGTALGTKFRSRPRAGVAGTDPAAAPGVGAIAAPWPGPLDWGVAGAGAGAAPKPPGLERKKPASGLAAKEGADTAPTPAAAAGAAGAAAALATAAGAAAGAAGAAGWPG